MVRGRHAEGTFDEMGWSSSTWRILECTKCTQVFVEVVTLDPLEEAYRIDENGREEFDYVENIRYWPEDNRRSVPLWFQELVLPQLRSCAGDRLPDTLLELYTSLGSELRALSASGIQRSFEIAAEVLGVDPALSFPERLDVMVKSSYLDSTNRRRLNVIVESAQPTANKGRTPTMRELRATLEILEEFIITVFLKSNIEKVREARSDMKAAENSPRHRLLQRSKSDGDLT